MKRVYTLSKFRQFQVVAFLTKLKLKDTSKRCLQHDIALSFQSLLLGLGKLLIQTLSSRTCVCTFSVLNLHFSHLLSLPACLPSCLPSGHPWLFLSTNLTSSLTPFFLSFLLIYRYMYFLIIYNSFLNNLQSQRIYNPLSQHSLHVIIFFQITIFPLTMQQSIKHTWECEHAVKCGIKVAWVVVALKTSHGATLFILEGLWWHRYSFNVWRRQTSKGWNQATKKTVKITATYTLKRFHIKTWLNLAYLTCTLQYTTLLKMDTWLSRTTLFVPIKSSYIFSHISPLNMYTG